jgi:hypothetical protein
MRRIPPLLLCALLATPLYAQAGDGETSDEQAPRPPPKKKGKKHEAKGEMRVEDLSSAVSKPAPEVAPAEEPEKPEAPSAPFRRHRYAYFLGGGFLVAGLAFAYSAQGEAKRAETILSAREAAQALDNARASAATSNVLYGVAAATLLVALIFELLPAPAAENASLTFHF